MSLQEYTLLYCGVDFSSEDDYLLYASSNDLDCMYIKLTGTILEKQIES